MHYLVVCAQKTLHPKIAGRCSFSVKQCHVGKETNPLHALCLKHNSLLTGFFSLPWKVRIFHVVLIVLLRWTFIIVQLSLGISRGLVPGFLVATKICGCSNPTVCPQYPRIPHLWLLNPQMRNLQIRNPLIERADCIFIEKNPCISGPAQFKP